MPFLLHFGMFDNFPNEVRQLSRFSSKEARFDRCLYPEGKFSLEVTPKVLVEETSVGEGAEGGQEMPLGGSNCSLKVLAQIE